MSGLLPPIGATRAIWCPMCGQVKFLQEHVRPNSWRPMACSMCLKQPLTPVPQSNILGADDSTARTRPISATAQEWAVFRALEEVRCGGWRKQQDGRKRMCGIWLGTVNPRSIVKIRMRDPRSFLGLEAGGLVQLCLNCGTRYELLTVAA